MTDLSINPSLAHQILTGLAHKKLNRILGG